ncbi:unnamed protein product, partial [Phaeothamnion confervicola]
GNGNPISIRDAYDVARPRPTDRPWVMVCMVSSLDGSTVLDRRSGGLSSETDREVLATLRSLADVIVVGASTVRIEGYGPPRKPGQRIGVVSTRGDVDMSSELFRSGAGFLIVPDDAPPSPLPTVRAGVGTVDLRGAFAQLDVDLVQAEGGPQLNAALADADLIDELDLTLSPRVAGGQGARVTHGALPINRRMHLAHVLQDDGFLFTRYVRSD